MKLRKNISDQKTVNKFLQFPGAIKSEILNNLIVMLWSSQVLGRL